MLVPQGILWCSLADFRVNLGSIQAILLKCLLVSDDAARKSLYVDLGQNMALFSLQWPLSKRTLSRFREDSLQIATRPQWHNWGLS